MDDTKKQDGNHALSDDDLEAVTGGKIRLHGKLYTVVNGLEPCFTGCYEPGVNYDPARGYTLCREDHTELRTQFLAGLNPDTMTPVCRCGNCRHLEFDLWPYCGKSGKPT